MYHLPSHSEPPAKATYSHGVLKCLSAIMSGVAWTETEASGDGGYRSMARTQDNQIMSNSL